MVSYVSFTMGFKYTKDLRYTLKETETQRLWLQIMSTVDLQLAATNGDVRSFMNLHANETAQSITHCLQQC